MSLLYDIAHGAYVFSGDILHVFSPGHLAEHLQRYGALAVFFFVFLETLPPIGMVVPGVAFLMVAGSLIPDPLTGLLFFAAAVAGAAAGNTLMFLLGDRHGRSIAYVFRLTEARLAAADDFMRRFGRVSVFCGQFVGIVRPALAFAAGTTRMERSSYYASMLLSIVAWAVLYLFIGHIARKSMLLVVLTVGVGGFLLFPVAIYLARSRKTSEGSASGAMKGH